MADITDFKRNQFLIKKSETENKEEPGLQHKIARHRMLIFYRICIILAVIAIFLMCVYFNWKNKVYVDYEIRQQYSWTRAEQAQSRNLSGMLLTYSKDGMSCTDTRGKVVWNQTYEMQNPILRTCKNVVAVGDYNGRSIYVSDTTGNLGTIDTTMPIRDFCVAANGVVAAVLDDSTVTGIYLYSVSGEEIAFFRTTMSKSGYPLAIAISEDARQVAVSYLKAENGSLSSNIGFYNFSSVGQNYTDNLVGGYGYADAVVPLVSFMNNDNIFAVADNRLMFYQGKQKPVNTNDILIAEEIRSVFHNENYIGLVFSDANGEDIYRADIYNTAGTLMNSLHFNLEYKEILFDTAGIIIYNEEQCIIYDWSGQIKYEGAFKERIECVIPMGNIEKYTLVTNDSIQLIQLN